MPERKRGEGGRWLEIWCNDRPGCKVELKRLSGRLLEIEREKELRSSIFWAGEREAGLRVGIERLDAELRRYQWELGKCVGERWENEAELAMIVGRGHETEKMEVVSDCGKECD